MSLPRFDAPMWICHCGMSVPSAAVGSMSSAMIPLSSAFAAESMVPSIWKDHGDWLQSLFVDCCCDVRPRPRAARTGLRDCGRGDLLRLRPSSDDWDRRLDRLGLPPAAWRRVGRTGLADWLERLHLLKLRLRIRWSGADCCSVLAVGDVIGDRARACWGSCWYNWTGERGGSDGLLLCMLSARDSGLTLYSGGGEYLS